MGILKVYNRKEVFRCIFRLVMSEINQKIETDIKGKSFSRESEIICDQKQIGKLHPKIRN